VMKPITLAIALLANQKKPFFDPEAKMATANGSFPGRSRPISDVKKHAFLNMDMALQKSSNIYMARLVEKIVTLFGDKWYREQLQDRFGFGEKTAIELPAESAGKIPMPGKTHPNGALEWSKATPFSLAMGYNLQATSIQMIRALSTLVNGGYLVQPSLVLKIDDEERETSPKKVLNDEICTRVLHSMRFVTGQGGTGRLANVWGFTELGKTSTTKKLEDDGTYSSSKYIASFFGAAPAIKPAFVLYIALDEPEKKYLPGLGFNHSGSVAAAPLFRKIATRSLEYLGITPDDPHGYPTLDPRFDKNKASHAMESQKLNEKYSLWNGK